jgi:hypothetical protein
MLLELEKQNALGPARVVRAEANRVMLRVAHRNIWAVSALPFQYEYQAGDLVLAIGQEDSWYVIGVLKGRGHTTLTVPGNLTFQAPRGNIEFVSAGKVQIQSPEVGISTGKLAIVARSVRERFQSASRWVNETLQVFAGRLRTRVENESELTAERIVERAEGDVRIDGNQIHLG